MQSWLPRSALSATLNWVIFHFFAFLHLQTEVDQKSEPAQLEMAWLVHPVQGWWNGKEGTELSYPLLVQNVMRNCSGITNWDTWSRVSGFFSLGWRLQSLVKNNSEEQETQWNSVSNTLSCFQFSSAVDLRYSPRTYLLCLKTKCYWLKLISSTSQYVSWAENLSRTGL